MKLAVFGGTGFIGSHFIQATAADPRFTCVAYCSEPRSLVNIARHEVAIRLYSPAELPALDLEDDTDVIVNFSHPFSDRDGLSPAQQIDRFVEFVRSQKQRLPQLKLVHLSSMSVYEPFTESMPYGEDAALDPPSADTYARAKVRAESRLRGLPGAESWQLHLRPTVVYGEFCRPWTDRIMAAFRTGDVDYFDLSGRIQPIHGHDVVQVVTAALVHFRPGVFNLAGPEVVTWETFLEFCADIVGRGALRRGSCPSTAPPARQASAARTYWAHMKRLLGVIQRDESFAHLVAPITRLLPRSFVRRIGAWLLRIADPGRPPPRPVEPSLLMSGFYSRDRLVSTERFARVYGRFEFSTLTDSAERLRRYYAFRFTDAWPEF